MSGALRREDPADPPSPRHFLDLRDLDTATLRQMLEVAGQSRLAAADVSALQACCGMAPQAGRP